MPIEQKIQFNSECVCGCWVINEDLEELRELFQSYPASEEEIEAIKNPEKKKEYLSVRILLQELCADMGIEYNGLYRTESGKPHLIGSEAQISLSHANGFAAAVIHLKHKVGTDVEMIMKKLKDVKIKYLNEQEVHQINDDISKLCVAWSAKEGIVKMIGENGISMRDHIYLEPFQLRNEGKILASIRHPNHNKDIEVYFRKINNYYVSLAIDQE